MSTRLISGMTTFALAALASIALAQAPEKPATPAKPEAAKPAKSEKAKPEAAKPEATKPATPAAAPMAAPKPPAELDALKPYTGNWKCEVEVSMPGMPAPVKTKGTISTKWQMGNMWVTYVNKVAKSKEMPAVEGQGVVGYDTAKKEYMFFGEDSTGDYIDFTAPTVSATDVKWTGNGNMMGQVVPLEFAWSLQNKVYDLKITGGGQQLQHWVCKK